MPDEPTTAVIRRYLHALPGDTAAEPIVRELLERSVGRLRLLCATFLSKSYPRLTQPPLNLEADEVLGGRRGRAAHRPGDDPPPDRAPVLGPGQPAPALAAR
jgi:hypothetical protein